MTLTIAAAIRAAQYWRRLLMQPEDKDTRDAIEGLDSLKDAAMGALKAAGVAINGLSEVATLALANDDGEAAALAVQRARDAIAVLQESTGGS
jgi:hypothetical protein